MWAALTPLSDTATVAAILAFAVAIREDKDAMPPRGFIPFSGYFASL